MKREKRKVVGSRNHRFFFLLLLSFYSFRTVFLVGGQQEHHFRSGGGLRVRLGEKSHSSDCVLYEWLPCTSLPAALSLFLARKRYGEKKKQKRRKRTGFFSLPAALFFFFFHSFSSYIETGESQLQHEAKEKNQKWNECERSNKKGKEKKNDK